VFCVFYFEGECVVDVNVRVTHRECGKKVCVRETSESNFWKHNDANAPKRAK